MLNDRTYRVKLAESDAERAAAQALRYDIFVREGGATPTVSASGREHDDFDAAADQLILLSGHDVVGTYRLLRDDAARDGPGFYSDTEYDLSPLTATGRPLLELGRTCLAPAHRGGAALGLLWRAVADYVDHHGSEIVFGVASFPGTDVGALADGLALLHHRYRADPALRVSVRDGVTMDLRGPEAIDQLRAARTIPPLIKSYLRAGGRVGDGAFVDRIFNTTDVFMVLETAALSGLRGLPIMGRRAA
ncbi:MAG: GNAT family N-acyltransferase [Pseudomonadota bacterium]